MRFRLLRGIHQQDGQTYVAGVPGQDIVENSKADLCQRHNKPQSIRWQQLPESEPINAVPSFPPKEETPEDNLEESTVAELRQYAKDETIELGTAVRKDEIIQTIRNALQLQ